MSVCGWNFRVLWLVPTLVLTLVLVFAAGAWGAELRPTPLLNVRPRLLTPELAGDFRRMSLFLESRQWEDALPMLRRFLVLEPDAVMECDGGLRPVWAVCGDLARQLPEDALPAWREPMSRAVDRQLAPDADGFPAQIHDLERILREFPNSEREPEVRDRIAAEARPKDAAPGGNRAPGVWRVSMLRIEHAAAGVVFEDFLPEEQRGSLFPDRVWSTATAAVAEAEAPENGAESLDRAFFVARMGTRVTRWPDAERGTRPQAYLVALDVRAEGRLLWMKSPDSTDMAFAGNPVVAAGCVYIPVLRAGEACEFFLDAYRLVDGTRVFRTFLFTADVDPQEMEVHLPLRLGPDGLTVGGAASGVSVTVEPHFGTLLSGARTSRPLSGTSLRYVLGSEN